MKPLSVGEEAILRALRRRNRFVGSEELADELETTPNSLRVRIHNLRRKGVAVESRYDWGYRLREPA